LQGKNFPHLNPTTFTLASSGPSKGYRSRKLLGFSHATDLFAFAETYEPTSQQFEATTMGVKDVLSRKSGVIVGDDVLKLFNYAQEHKFAIPAVVSEHLIGTVNWQMLTTNRMLPLPPLSLLPSKLPAMPALPLSSRCPKVARHTSLERYI
jgi:hypothetical protein